MTEPIRIAVTGAGGQIGYALLFRIASGSLFGPDRPVSLRLLEITPALPSLNGTLMELEDCAFPMLADVRPLARLTGAPYWPLTPTFPLLGPLGLVPLPSKWLIEFGEPIPTDELDPGAAEDPMVVFEITDRVREVIQQTLYALLVQRGSVFLG